MSNTKDLSVTFTKLGGRLAGKEAPKAAPAPEPVPDASHKAPTGLARKKAPEAAPAPAAGEATADLSHKVPASLLGRLEMIVVAMRNAGPKRLGQKDLPTREVVAAILWDVVGEHPASKDAGEMLELLERYRAR